ncbi:MAG: hypothetical protein KDD58_06420 [Bdellovibrionales bacterium]|nr:hypothetical protein [Bdellovibrionales bacterium]
MFLIVFILQWTFALNSVREVNNTSCDVIPIRLGLGVTTQLIFEQEPKVTLYADKAHFKISTNELSPRSLAIIPFIEKSEIENFRNSKGDIPGNEYLAKMFDKSFRTNLFVFFKNNNQLMFELRFVEKKQADYIVKVNQKFDKGCLL